MDGDPNFRLKAFAVLACVLGVFLVVFVAQRAWYWLKSKRREDVETSNLAPIIDFGLLGLGCVVIWLAIEALVLAVLTGDLPVQPDTRRKIAEIEVGKLDEQTDQLNLLFYPVDRAGRRMAEQRRPVLTSGDYFELEVETLQWRTGWNWLGRGGFYRFIGLAGHDPRGATQPQRTEFELRPVPRTVGAMVFMRAPQPTLVRQPCRQGDIYDIVFDPAKGRLEVELHPRQ